MTIELADNQLSLIQFELLDAIRRYEELGLTSPNEAIFCNDKANRLVPRSGGLLDLDRSSMLAWRISN
jgi:hypothetical protein